MDFDQWWSLRPFAEIWKGSLAHYESISIGEDHLPDAEEAGRELMAWQVFPAWGTVAKRVRDRLAKTKKWHDDQNAAYVAEWERQKSLEQSKNIRHL